MKLKNLAYAAFVAATAAAFVIGSAVPSEAAKKKKAAAAQPTVNVNTCSNAPAAVCATKGGMKFTYANACLAVRDGAKIASEKACPVKAAKKGGKKKAKKKA